MTAQEVVQERKILVPQTSERSERSSVRPQQPCRPVRNHSGCSLSFLTISSVLQSDLAFTKLADDALPDYYSLLSVSPDASAAEVKQAYHQALLRHHPDKRHGPHASAAGDVNVALIQQAYRVLSSPASRAAYDASRAEAQAKGGPRPAQVVSLEEFAESGDGAGRMTWTYSCRCGGTYIVREEQLEDGQHLVGCNSCSEVVWVGFEVADEVEDEES